MEVSELDTYVASMMTYIRKRRIDGEPENRVLYELNQLSARGVETVFHHE
jgi:hypothetical protein